MDGDKRAPILVVQEAQTRSKEAWLLRSPFDRLPICDVGQMKRTFVVFITASLVFLACGQAGIGPTLTPVPTATAGPAVVEPPVSTATAGSLIVDAQSLYWSSCDAWER